jgi:phosphatidylethanolamine N-methyltransferase
LVLVENPHIERTYGSSEQKVEDNRSVLYDPSTGLFPDRKDAILLVDVDPFRASDLALIIFVCYGLGFCALVTEKWWCIVHAAVWRVAHFAGLGIVLWRQGRSQYWTSHFTQRGRSLHEAFDNWKRVYNLSLTMNMFVFFGAAVRYFEWPVEGWLNPSFLAHFLGGLALISINYWSMTSSYAAIGDFGFFYGDFFIPKKDYQAPLVYTGIYRFLNDPDCVTGVAGLHGLALICRSWTIFALALGSQLLQLAFLHLVEIPYMNKLYTNAPLKQHDALSPSSSRRKHSPFRAKIISKLRTVFAESIEEAASEDAAPQAVPAAKSAKSAKTKAATPKAAVATPKVATPKAASAETPRARQRKQSAAETNVTEPSPKAVRTPRAKKQA